MLVVLGPGGLLSSFQFRCSWRGSSLTPSNSGTGSASWFLSTRPTRRPRAAWQQPCKGKVASRALEYDLNARGRNPRSKAVEPGDLFKPLHASFPTKIVRLARISEACQAHRNLSLASSRLVSQNHEAQEAPHDLAKSFWNLGLSPRIPFRDSG